MFAPMKRLIISVPHFFKSFLSRIIIVELFILLFCSGQILAADSPGIKWQETYGGTEAEKAQFVRPTDDGGFILTGYSYSYGAGKSDLYLVKTDGSGREKWEKTYGEKRNDGANCVEPSSDGTYIVAGYSESSGEGKNDVYVLKINTSGEKVWELKHGGAGNDEAFSVKQTSDGGYIVAGYSESQGEGGRDVYLLKLSASGELRWEKTIGGKGMDAANWIEQCKDGSFILTGYSDSFGTGERALLLLKVDASGDLLWKKTFCDSGLNGGNCVQETSDGGYIVAGYKYLPPTGGTDCYLLKTNNSGDLIWEKNFGLSYKNSAVSVEETAEGYIVLGNTFSYGSSDWGTYLLRTDLSGNLMQEKTLGRDGPDFASCGQPIADGSYIVVGSKNMADPVGDNAYLLKLDLDICFLSGEQIEIEEEAVTVSEEENADEISSGNIVWPDMSEYRGALQNGKANGWGRVSFPDGGSYEGEWKDNMFNGQGILTAPDGSQYKGSFRDNMFYGEGTYTWATGEKYVGEFLYNKRHGQGVLSWYDGTKYVGEFQDNEAHGYGNIMWPNGENYSGQMKKGKAEGMGTYIYANGDRYVGHFKDLVFEGLGTYTWASGAQYTGGFKEDMMYGQGTYTWPNGVQQWGYWQNDRYIGLYPEDIESEDY